MQKGILLNMLQDYYNCKKTLFLKFVQRIYSHIVNRQNYP